MRLEESMLIGFFGGLLGAAVMYVIMGFHLTVVTGTIGGALGGLALRWILTKR